MGLSPEYVAKIGKDVTEDTVELDFDFPEVSKVDKQDYNINQPKWAGAFGNLGENLLPTAIDLGNE